MTEHVLDNPIWNALTTAQASFAQRHGRALRYRPEVSLFAAIERPDPQAWADLAALSGPRAVMMIARRERLEPPAGWEVLFAGSGHQMILNDALVDVDRPTGMRPLTDADNPAAIALVKLTEPGPFAPRTIELGGYHGIFDGSALVAMAGQRASTDDYTEISAVCTHPDARRRGYAAAVSAEVARGILANGRTPILHVAESNTGARRVYEALGFSIRAELTFQALRTP